MLPSKICAIGLNYLDHVLEGGRPIPKSPVLFAKYPTSVIGHGDAIRWEPALSDKIDLEAELAVVIATRRRTCGLWTLTSMSSVTPVPTT